MSGISDLARALSGKGWAGQTPPTDTPLEDARVKQVTAGGGPSGSDAVTVTWRGSDVTVRNLDSCTCKGPLSVGDTVLVGHYRNDLYILGRLVGGL